LWADVLAGGADIFHSPDFTLPPLLRARSVLTVHDLTFLHYPEHAPRGLVDYLSQVVPRSVRRANVVVADSESTRRDLIERWGTAPEKVRVVYAGVSADFSPVADPAKRAEVCSRYGIRAPFILTVGTLQPRKNHLRLVQAFSRLQMGGAHPDLTLAIAGGSGWQYDQVRAEVARLGPTERVRFAGFVQDADLPALYSSASVLAFPSLYEGFGLPVLEAMACGTPVVCSSASSLPEVAGDAALMVDPADTQALADAIDRALSDTGLREGMSRRGLAQAARFTWAAAAGSLLDAYRLALGD
jgi:glycosyltransferase involved in cell wall biosynthesis